MVRGLRQDDALRVYQDARDAGGRQAQAALGALTYLRRREEEQRAEQAECVVCHDSPKQIMFLPCGCVAICSDFVCSIVQ